MAPIAVILELLDITLELQPPGDLRGLVGMDVSHL